MSPENRGVFQFLKEVTLKRPLLDGSAFFMRKKKYPKKKRLRCRCPTSSGHEEISLKLFVISLFIMSYETLSFPENPQVLISYLAPIPY